MGADGSDIAAGAGVKASLLADLADALGALKAGGPLGERVHRARRRLKHGRSLLRVLEPAAPDVAPPLRQVLKDAGRALAGVREREVLLAAAAELRPEVGEEAAAALDAVHTDAAGPGFDPVPVAARLIADGVLLARRLPDRDGGLLAAALKRLARRSRKAFRRARARSDNASLHEWRKRLKDLIHVVGAIGGAVRHRKATLTLAGKAETLLGEDHDLALLAAKLGATRDAGGAVAEAIRRRRRRLHRRAFAIGRRLQKADRPALRRP